jgi:phosphotransferase system enzyme I (PtsI)
VRGERTVLSGISASSGIAVGPARVVLRSALRVARRQVSPEEIPVEIARLRRAIESSRAEIESARSLLGDGADSETQLVLDAHLLMHRDELLVDATVRAIEGERLNAEWALSRTVESLSRQLARANSEYFRDRADDVEHVGQHILRWLSGVGSIVPDIDQPVVLVAEDLSPAEAAQLGARPVLGIVTERGSATSHTAILARALGIPALVGVPGATDRVLSGDTVVLDALRGALVCDADDEELLRADERRTRYRGFVSRLEERADERTETSDGVRVHVFANLEIPAEAAQAKSARAEGIGLYRTEYLLLGRGAMPTEDEQRDAYADVLTVVAPRPVTFRTFDLGADKLPGAARRAYGPNPALGLRAIRLALARPEMLRAQVRAILRAAHDTGATERTKVMFPLVTTFDELRAARRAVDEARFELAREGIGVDGVSVGAMIEVPSAALVAPSLASECDFFSIGTNDLVQYTLAIDRTNPEVAASASALDPAVLHLLDRTARAARDAGIGLSMCGDMAADPIALPIVLGLGFRDLSVPTSALALTRAIVSRVDAKMAEDCAREALTAARAEDVAKCVRTRFAPALAELWNEEAEGS